MNFGRIFKIGALVAGATTALLMSCSKDEDDRPRAEQDGTPNKIFKANTAKNDRAGAINDIESLLSGSTPNASTLELENSFSMPSISTKDTVIHVPETWEKFDDALGDVERTQKSYGKNERDARDRLAGRNKTGRWVYKKMTGAEFRSYGLSSRIDSEITNTEPLNTPKVFSNIDKDEHLVMVRYSVDPSEPQPAWVTDAIGSKGWQEVTGGAGNMSQVVHQLVGNINIDASTHVVVDFKDMEAILTKIQNLLGDFTTQYGVDMAAVLAYLEGFSVSFDDLNATQQSVYKLLLKLRADVQQGNAENTDFHKKILQLMVKFGESNDADHRKIIALLEKIADTTGASRNILNQILTLVQNLPAHDYSQALADIFAAIQANTGAINNLNESQQTNFAAVLAALASQTAEQRAGFTAILAALTNQPDYGAKLDVIIQQLMEANGNITSYGQQILAKMGQMQTTLNNIANSNEAANVKLQRIIELLEGFTPGGSTTVDIDLSVLEATTQAILDKMNDLIPPNYQSILEQILAKIPDKIGCNCNCDCDAIINLLVQILGELQSGNNEGDHSGDIDEIFG